MKVSAAFGGGIAGKSYVVTRQRRVNCYYENRPDGDKTRAAIYATPGAKLAGSFLGSGPGRGMATTPLGCVYAAGGNFGVLSASLGTSFSAALGTSSGNVSFAASPSQVLVVDGLNGYVYNGANLALVASAGFPPRARTCTFLGGFFVAELPGTQQFQVSNSYDATTWQALAFAQASQGSDILQAVDQSLSNLVLFCALHSEFWQNVGATPQPFAPILSATVEWGLAAIFSRVHVDNTICFLGQSPQGGVSVCRLSGYEVRPISDPDLDAIMATFPVVSDAVGLTYRADKHAMYQITFPSANRSFLYDTSTGIWSETQTGVGGLYAQRHLGQFSALSGSQLLVSDYQTSNFYTMDPGTFTDNSQVTMRELITKAALADHNVFSIDEIYLDMETGVGLPSGQGSAPVVQLEISKDNGRTWLTPRTAPLGAQGVYKDRVVWRRGGSSRVFHFRIRQTDPVKFVLTAPATSQRERKQ